MGKQILVDDDKLEHLLNCMAQLSFLPAYLEMRDVLSKAAMDPCSVPPSGSHPIMGLIGELIHDWSKIEDKTVYVIRRLPSSGPRRKNLHRASRR